MKNKNITLSMLPEDVKALQLLANINSEGSLPKLIQMLIEGKRISRNFERTEFNEQ